MSFGSNGEDQVRLLQKISNQFRLANLFVNSTCSASFATTLVQERNGSKRQKTCVLGLMEWMGALVMKNSDATLFSELVRSWHLFCQFCHNFRAATK
jgi:hypothetical protein